MKLTQKHASAAVLLAYGSNNHVAAEEAGVSVQTLCEWKKNADFQAIMNQVVDEYMKEATIKLNNLAGEAIDTISDLLANSESENIRLKAAQSVLAMLGAGRASKWGWSVGDTSPERIRTKEIMKDMQMI